MIEYGIFNDEATGWSAEEAVESGFYSRESAERAIRERYDEDDELEVHLVEEPEEKEDDDDEDDDDEDDDSDEE